MNADRRLRIFLPNLFFYSVFFITVSSISQTVSDDANDGSISGEALLPKQDVRMVERFSVNIVTFLKAGLGNQINCLVHALALARRTRSKLVFPLTPSRFKNKCYNHNGGYPLLPSSLFWDVQLLSRISDLTAGLPSGCDRQIDIFYTASRSAINKRTVSAKSISGHPLLEICYHAGYIDGTQISENCKKKVFGNTTFIFRHVPLVRKDDSFMNEVADLRYGKFPPELSASTLKRVKSSPSSSICVFVDGYSFNRRDVESNQYLYSFHHYLQPSRRIRHEFSRFLSRNRVRSDELAVLHLRYDEHLCHNKSMKTRTDLVCIRSHLHVTHKKVVYLSLIHI